MSNLYVFYKTTLVGELTKNEDATLSFEYSAAWIKSEKTFPLSPALKLKEGSFNNRESLAFFENLIPEGEVKDRLEKLIGKSLDSGYQFLGQFGVDCAGAFVISANKEAPSLIVDNELEKLDAKELSLAHNDNQNLMVHVMQKHNGRFSLAGAQDKIPVTFKNNELYIPTKGAPTSHILKPPHLSRSVKDSVYNEYFCMKLASALGINVADVDIIVNEVPFYLTKRYDRELESEDKIARLHQVDFCQAQNRLVSEKYESDGGPTLKDNYKVIQKYSSNVIKDTRRYLEWICFNILIGNNDSHSKNISFLLNDNKLVLSPFYDLICTSIYKEYNSDFAFCVGGVNSWGQWDKNHFRNEIISWGLDKSPNLLLDTLLKLMEAMQKTLPLEVETFNDQFPEIKVANRIKVEIDKRMKSFSKRLEKS